MKYAIYIRVSTRKQGSSDLGLEAQRKMCEDFIVANGGEKADALCRDFNKRFYTYNFRSCQTTINTETKTFIYIYKKHYE